MENALRRDGWLAKVAAVLFSILLVIGLMPASAFARPSAAGEDSPDVDPKAGGSSGTVYISLSDDGLFVPSEGVDIEGTNNGYMAYVPVDLAAVAAVDLSQVETASGESLGGYEYAKDPAAPTMLKLFVYVAQHYSAYGTSTWDVTGSSGSMFLRSGFWGSAADGKMWDLNLNYYLNGAYPLERPGWGATADQIELHDGDFIDVAHWTSWDAPSAAYSPFDYFMRTDVAPSQDAITHEYSASVGQPLTLRLGHAGADGGSSYGTQYGPSAGIAIHAGSSYDTASAFSSDIVTDKNGEAQVTFDEPGTYYVWADGYDKNVDTGGGTYVSSSAAVAKVTVRPGIRTGEVTGIVGQPIDAQLEAAGLGDASQVTWQKVSGPSWLSVSSDGKVTGSSDNVVTAGSLVVRASSQGVSAERSIDVRILRKYNTPRGTVHVSVAKDGRFVTSDGARSGTLMSYVPVDLADAAKVDLDDYGLGAFKKAAMSTNATYAYEVTDLQVALCALRDYYAGGIGRGITVSHSAEGMSVTGFWGAEGPYLTFAVNGQTPISADGSMLGLDSAIAHDGDDIAFGVLTGSGVRDDAHAGDHWFVDAVGDEAKPVHEASATAGTPLTLTLEQVAYGSSEGKAYATHAAAAGYPVSYGKAYGAAEGSATTAADGTVTVTLPSAGTWYVWADGQRGVGTEAVVSNPALVVVDVSAAPAVEVTAPVAATDLVYDGQEQTGVADGEDYTVSGGSAVHAGSYVATATLSDGYIWDDGTTAPKEVRWSMAPATLTAEAPIATMTAGGDVPALACQVAGFVGAESPAVARDYVAPKVQVIGVDGKPVADGLIRALAPGTYVTRAAGGAAGDYDFSYVDGILTVEAAAGPTTEAPVITTTALPTASVGSAYNAMIEATGTPTPSIAGTGLPEGLMLTDNGDGTATISGTPTRAGTYTVTISAHNGSAGQETVASKPFYLYVVEASEPQPAASRVERLAGAPADGAAGTAAEIADASFPDGADTVVIARNNDYHDALAGAGYAGALGAPVLLTDSQSLSKACIDEMSALGATRAVILGGESAVSSDVAHQLDDLGFAVDRVAGDDVYGTSMAITRALLATGQASSQYAIAVNPTTFADAVSISGWAYANHVPVMLQTWGDTSAERGYDDEAKAILRGRDLVVCGGRAAVSDESVSGLGAARVTRLGGDTIYETSLAIANWEIEHGMSAKDVTVASAIPDYRGVDALAASALAGRAGGVTILAQSNDNGFAWYDGGETVLGFVRAHADQIERVHVLGGEVASTPALYDAIRSALGEGGNAE